MKIKYFIAPLVIALMFFTSTELVDSVPLDAEEPAEEPVAATESQGARSSSKSLGFTPVSKELHLSPGEVYTEKATIWHQADGDMNYSIVIRGFKQIEDHPGTAVLLSEEEEMASTTSAANWFHIETTEVVVPPQHNFELNYLIEVPEDVASGEYYAQIFFHSEQDPLPVTGEEVMAYSNIAGGPTFLIRTGDEMDEEITILDFKTTHRFYERPEVTFNTSVQNNGNVHLKPTGVIVLTNMFGQELASIEFNPTRKALIRDSIATYVSEWETNYLLTDDGKLAAGPITAELTMYYKSDSPGYHPLTAETEFWIFQWKLALAVLGAIIVLVWTIKAVKKSKKVKTTESVDKVNVVETPAESTNTPNDEMPKEEKKDTL